MNQGISILDEDAWDSVHPYVRKAGVNYPVVIATDRVTAAYGGVKSLPATFIIDRQGRIAAAHMGLVSKGVYEKDILSVLHEQR
jgi:cytochrome c biogenesis protein CcmG/thiol:disulfide interchange protein DsbE